MIKARYSTLFFIVACIITLLTLASLGESNFILGISTKSEICPHGVHYLDACKNMCICDAVHGGQMCSRVNRAQDCHDELTGICPYGDKFKDPLWGSSFECQCNKMDSQTYECFDLTKLKHDNIFGIFGKIWNPIDLMKSRSGL